MVHPPAINYYSNFLSLGRAWSYINGNGDDGEGNADGNGDCDSAPCIEAAGQMRNWCIPVHFDTMPSFLKYLKAVFFWKLRLVMIVRIARQ